MKLLLLFSAGALLAQVPTVLSQGNKASEKAQQELTQALTESNASPMEAVRALEAYLKKYPDAPARAEIERMLVKAAIDTKDDRRTRSTASASWLSRPTTWCCWIAWPAPSSRWAVPKTPRKALEHAKVFEAIIVQLGPGSGRDAGRKQEERDRSLARMLLFQSRAKSQMGKKDEAEPLAARAFSRLSQRRKRPRMVGCARRAGPPRRRCAALGRRVRDPGRARFRCRSRVGSEVAGRYVSQVARLREGLGDVILSAYDRTTALLEERLKRMKSIDPNTGVTDPMDFTLTGVDGSKLALNSLRGSVVISISGPPGASPAAFSIRFTKK
jgi:hypothetical protein